MDSYVKMLKPLIGGKIKKMVVDPTPDGEVYLGLIIENGKKTYEIIALQDPEGNGPGHLSIHLLSDYSKKPVDNESLTV